MPTYKSTCDLAEALAAQEVDAGVFLPFTVRCLQGQNPAATHARLSVRLALRDGLEREESLQVLWSLQDQPALPPAVQRHTVVEWGALGVACIVLYAFGEGLRLVEVAAEGDRFDYWVGDDRQMWGLEVSGTDTGSLTERHEQKVQQLSENPWAVDGFVIVARFASQECRFTFHRTGRENRRRT